MTIGSLNQVVEHGIVQAPSLYPNKEESNHSSIIKIDAFREQAVITIQRAFRYSRPVLRAEVRKRVPLSDHLALQITSQIRGIESLPMNHIPRPKPGTYQIDFAKAKKWVAAHPPEIKPLAQKFINCITYRSHNKFERQLQLTCQDFNRRLYAIGENKRNYIMVINHGEDGFNSSAWIQLLALKYLDEKYLVGVHDLSVIIRPNMLRGSITNDLKLCHNLLICDDATYSGNQTSKIFKDLLIGTDKEVFMVIPFMTTQSIKKVLDKKEGLQQYASECQSDLSKEQYEHFKKNRRSQICAHQIMFTCEELGIKYANLSKLSPFVLNHKIACNASVPEEIFKTGRLLTSFDIQDKIPFIQDANTLPIYKQSATRIRSSL